MIIDPHKKVYQYPLSYNGNIIWPILFLFLFPPLGVALMLLNASFRRGNRTYFLYYKGSTFWLLFWTVCFFPIAIVLAVFNGFDVIELAD